MLLNYTFSTKQYLGNTVLFAMIFLSMVGVYGRPTNVTEDHVKRKCADLSYFKVENVTDTWCCNCHAGYFMQAECQNSNTPNPTCEECEFSNEKKTFMNVNNHAPACYESRKSCDNVMNTVMKIGSTKQDNTCQCKDGYYRESDQGYCKIHTPCDKGFGIAELGSKSADTVCVKCEGNQFSDTVSSTGKCKPHSECKGGQKKVFEGNSTSDVECLDIAVTPPLVSNFSKFSTTNDPGATAVEVQVATEVSGVSTPVEQEPNHSFPWWATALIVLIPSYILGICFEKKFAIYNKIFGCKRGSGQAIRTVKARLVQPRDELTGLIGDEARSETTERNTGVPEEENIHRQNEQDLLEELASQHQNDDDEGIAPRQYDARGLAETEGDNECGGPSDVTAPLLHSNPGEGSSERPDQIPNSDAVKYIDSDNVSTNAFSNRNPKKNKTLLPKTGDSNELEDIDEVSGGPSLVTKGSENIDEERHDIAVQNKTKNTSSTDEVQPSNGTVSWANVRRDPSVCYDARQGSYPSENEHIAEENRHRNEGHPDYPELFPDWLHQEVFAFGEQRVNDTLDSHDTGKGMLCGEHGLCNEIETIDLRKLMRDKKLLPSSRIIDIEDETKDRLNLRHRWMTCVAQNYGRKLTPRFLFKLTLHYEPQYIYDAMYAVFKSALNQHA